LNYFSGLVAGFRLARTPTLDKYEERSSETTLRRGREREQKRWRPQTIAKIVKRKRDNSGILPANRAGDIADGLVTAAAGICPNYP